MESRNYDTIDNLNALAQSDSLVNIPLQPLYLALKNCSHEEISTYLPMLSSEQRSWLLDIDLWNADHLDTENFERWLDIYDKSDESLRSEFLKSEQFALYFKGRLSIHTFDVEDPWYPEHDNYFLTPDNLLLIEFDESYTGDESLKRLLDALYGELGVEKAYTYLFKVVSDNFTSMMEDEYRQKKLRLMDVGILDYFESLELLAPFHSIGQIKNFIKLKDKTTGNLDGHSVNQALHKQSIVGFEKDFESIIKSLTKIEEQQRKDFLQFSFVRLINSTIALENALKNNSLSLGQNARKVKFYLNLGHSFVLDTHENYDQLFEFFDFTDLYKIGVSLLRILQNKFKKSLREIGFDSIKAQGFLGGHINSLIDSSFQDEVKFKLIKFKENGEKIESDYKLDSAESYDVLNLEINDIITWLPFAKAFLNSLENLKESGGIQDQYYLNYDGESIDFEAIILSSFINFDLENYDKEATSKMGVNISELRDFTSKYFSNDNESKLIYSDSLKTSIDNFIDKFALTSANNFSNYILTLLDDHLAGYNFTDLNEDEFSHVGGPIILDIKGH